MAKRVRLYKDQQVYVLELCSPPANLTDQLFFSEMVKLVEVVQSSRDCEGLIIKGSGRHFSSGADISELKKRLGRGTAAGIKESGERSLAIFEEIAKLKIPVVAAIQGCCLGSGLELALACHFRIATKNALFSMPETGYELMPGCGGTIRLPKIIGIAKSIEFILSGRNYLAEDALQMQLIDKIVDKKDLMSTAQDIIDTIGVQAV